MRAWAGLLVGSAVAGVSLVAAIVGVGPVAFTGLVVFVLVETSIVLHLLGFEPSDLR